MKTKISDKTKIRVLLPLIALLAALPAALAADQQLSPVMRRNQELVLELQKYTATPEAFAAPANQARIRALVGELRKNAHAIPHRLNETNPGQAAIATLFGEYLSDIQRSLAAGNSGYVRNKIRTATGFCMECHTSLAAAPNFADMEKSVTASMPAFDRAEFFAATRQFDLALEEYRKVFYLPLKAEDARLRLSRAVRGALSVTVRVKRDPAATLAVLDQVSKLEGLPSFLASNVRKWQADAKAWQAEGAFNAKSAGEWLAKSEALFNRVEAKQAYPADHSMDISLFRAVSYAQEALSRKPGATEKARAFYLLGAANSILADPLLWALDEIYYESCIREMPHSNIARQCFDRFAQELYFEYSGSSGTDLAPEEVERLTRLRELAQ